MRAHPKKFVDYLQKQFTFRSQTIPSDTCPVRLSPSHSNRQQFIRIRTADESECITDATPHKCYFIYQAMRVDFLQRERIRPHLDSRISTYDDGQILGEPFQLPGLATRSRSSQGRYSSCPCSSSAAGGSDSNGRPTPCLCFSLEVDNDGQSCQPFLRG